MGKMIKIMTVFGTRPEAIKMAPLVKAIENEHVFSSKVVVTAQHRQMLDQVLEIFKIKPDYDLNVMRDKQSLSGITSRVMTELEPVLQKEKPDLILVHGDTTTTFAAALCAFYHQIPIGHVEAGLRTWNKYSPFPEEMNRQLTDQMSDLYFAPTEQSRANLLQENHQESAIFITGNTAIDALKYTKKENYHHPLLDKLSGRPVLLLTMHRRESIGQPMVHVFHVINQLMERFPDLQIIFPIHKNPLVRDLAEKTLVQKEQLHVIEPLDAVDFHNFLARSTLVLSDSGGVQEEAPYFGIPVLVLRETTERPEGVAAGTLKLVGTDESAVFQTACELLTDQSAYEKMAQAANPYGDGHASEKILAAIKDYFAAAESGADLRESEK